MQPFGPVSEGWKLMENHKGKCMPQTTNSERAVFGAANQSWASPATCVQTTLEFIVLIYSWSTSCLLSDLFLCFIVIIIMSSSETNIGIASEHRKLTRKNLIHKDQWKKEVAKRKETWGKSSLHPHTRGCMGNWWSM